jgi:hypothetical protein
MVDLMRWLKGVVIGRKHGLVHIEMETGRKVWATPTFHLAIQEQVLISWDYTEDNIGILTTRERLNSMETDQERAESQPSDVFQSPLGEEFEGDVSDLDVPTDSGNPTEEESDVSEERSFPIPLDEDVDPDNIVLLKDDISVI